jgi:hypothetical protein
VQQEEQHHRLKLGDWIECDLNFPTPHTRLMRLNTDLSLAFGLRLVSDPASGWRVSSRNHFETKIGASASEEFV